MNFLRIAICCLLATQLADLSLAADDAPGRPNDRIRVHLHDGRLISGHLDPRTSNEHLWIQMVEESIVARSGFRWDCVQKVVQNDQSFAPDVFRSLITPASFEPAPAIEATTVPCASCDPAETRSNRQPTTVVRSLDIRAVVANWDSDVEPDGLLVEVIPRDEWGDLASVHGQIAFTLIGENTPYDPQDVFQPRPRYPELTRSSNLVRESDFSEGAPVYRVPFGVAHPDFRFDVANEAVLTASLSVPGQGVFRASDDGINLRPGNWIRDRRQQFFGTRYFRQEGTVYRR